jgi:LmbE family N-acetylglucosaminyl deacetylase
MMAMLKKPNRLFVVSPHLDDAVFSCGMLLASHPASVVCTVLAGAPEVPQRKQWDVDSGFADSCAALALLAADPVRLPFLDSQYGAPRSMTRVAAALAGEVQQHPDFMLLVPLGLWHPDHIFVSSACCEMLRMLKRCECIFYEDALYRTLPGVARQRRELLASRGFSLAAPSSENPSQTAAPGAAAFKRRSARAYRSQLRAFADPYPNDLAEPERYWQWSSHE